MMSYPKTFSNGFCNIEVLNANQEIGLAEAGYTEGGREIERKRGQWPMGPPVEVSTVEIAEKAGKPEKVKYPRKYIKYTPPFGREIVEAKTAKEAKWMEDNGHLPVVDQ